jgi:hypothetical protein
MIDENDLHARKIFEQPKTNKNATRKKQEAKSPNSNSRLGKSGRISRQRKQSR